MNPIMRIGFSVFLLPVVTQFLTLTFVRDFSLKSNLAIFDLWVMNLKNSPLSSRFSVQLKPNGTSYY